MQTRSELLAMRRSSGQAGPVPPIRGRGRGMQGLALALLGLAFLSRFIPTLWPNYWYDEVFSALLAQLSPQRILSLTRADVHPPVYYWWLHLFVVSGRWLGGPFESLAWLRLASVIPGWLACLAGWRIGRRWWGELGGLAVLALLAVAPALTYYSVELRNYALVHLMLLVATFAMVELLGGRGRPLRWAVVYVIAMTLALYSHSLVAIYMMAQGVVVLLALVWARGRRARLLGWSLSAAALTLVLHLPWLGVMLGGKQAPVGEGFFWLPWARWPDLAVSLFYHLPWGPLKAPNPMSGAAWLIMGVTVVAGLGVVIWALACRRAWDGADDPLVLPALTLMVVVPIAVKFYLSSRELAPVFMSGRYNLMAAPFFVLLVAGLVVRLRPKRAGMAVLGLIMLLMATGSVAVMRERMYLRGDLHSLTMLPEPPNRSETMVLLDSAMVPWLGRLGPYRMVTLEEAAQAFHDGGPTWFLSHRLSQHGLGRSAAAFETVLLAGILDASPCITRVLSTEDPGMKSDLNLWRVEPGALKAVVEQRREVLKRFSERQIPRGQVILAHDETFDRSSGWSGLEFQGLDQLPWRWSQGPRPRLEWTGPPSYGFYHLKLHGWRAQPLPTAEVEIGYRLPGEEVFRTLRVGPGALEIEGVIEVKGPGQRLQLDLRLPVWRPIDHLPGSTDRRELGIMFLEMELHPTVAGDPGRFAEGSD